MAVQREPEYPCSLPAAVKFGNVISVRILSETGLPRSAEQTMLDGLLFIVSQSQSPRNLIIFPKEISLSVRIIFPSEQPKSTICLLYTNRQQDGDKNNLLRASFFMIMFFNGGIGQCIFPPNIYNRKRTGFSFSRE